MDMGSETPGNSVEFSPLRESLHYDSLTKVPWDLHKYASTP